MSVANDEFAMVTLRQGIAMRRAGEKREALNIFKSLLRVDPRNQWARVESSTCFRELGELGEAKSILEEGLAIESRSPHLKVALADIYLLEGGFCDARKFYESSIEDAPHFGRGHSGLIGLFIAQGEIGLAANAAERALASISSEVEQANFLAEYAQHCGRFYGGNVDVYAKIAPASPAMRNAVIVSLVKDEGDIMFQGLSHHYKLGFRYFAILNNMSSDDTCAKVHKFRDTHPEACVIVADDPILGHYQGAKVTNFLRYATNYFGISGAKIEWIFTLDADEFIWVPENGPSLSEVLGYADSNNELVLAFILNNAASKDVLLETGDFENIETVFDKREPFGRRPVCKVAFRFDPAAVVAEGNHFVSGIIKSVKQIRHATCDGIFIAHHPNRSIKQVRSKILNGAVSLNNAPGIIAGGHWRAHYEKYIALGEPYIRRQLENYIIGIKKSSDELERTPFDRTAGGVG